MKKSGSTDRHFSNSRNPRKRAQTASLGKKTESELVIFLPVYYLFLDQSSRKRQM